MPPRTVWNSWARDAPASASEAAGTPPSWGTAMPPSAGRKQGSGPLWGMHDTVSLCTCNSRLSGQADGGPQVGTPALTAVSSPDLLSPPESTMETLLQRHHSHSSSPGPHTGSLGSSAGGLSQPILQTWKLRLMGWVEAAGTRRAQDNMVSQSLETQVLVDPRPWPSCLLPCRDRFWGSPLSWDPISLLCTCFSLQ